MVLCKFFQQGNCRYGQSCRFEHIYGSKYSYHAPSHSQPAIQQTSTVTDEQLANQVHSDVQAALNGGQWILSCYAPFKEKPGIPGISDLSPEEARLFIYEAKANGNTEAAVAFINKLTHETRSKFEQLLQPTPAVMNLLKGLYHGGAVQSPFTSQNQGFGTSNSSDNSIFRSAVQNAGFGQASNFNNSIFSPSSNAFNNQQSTSIFGSQQQDAAKSIFASANQNVFGAAKPINPFQTATQDSAKSIFAQATQNVFGSAPASQAPTNVFGGTQNMFGQPDIFKQSSDIFAPPQVAANVQASATGNVFQISDQPTTNIFGNIVRDPVIDETAIYSKMEDLSPSDIEAFQAPSFKLGFVPELPPPSNLCR